MQFTHATGDMRRYGANIIPKNLSEVVHEGLRRGDATSRRMENQVQAFLLVNLVNGHHEAVLVLVCDVCTANARLREEGRVVGDDISACVLIQLLDVIPADVIYCTTSESGSRLLRLVD